MRGWHRLGSLFGVSRRGDVDDELRFHIEMRERELIARGETPERARELALLRFGDYDASRAECVAIEERRGRRMARRDYISEVRQDIVYALRTLRRKPGFTAVAVLTLGLGIGANSAIFSVVNAVVFESLPYAEPDRLYAVNTRYPDGTDYALSPPDFMSVQAESRALEAVAAYTGATVTLLDRGEPKEVRGALVSRGFLELLGLGLERGRGFTAEENEPGGHHVAILSHDFWRREFGGERVLDRPLRLAGEVYTIVGILAAGAGVPGDWDIYAPLPYDSTFSATAAAGRRGEYLDGVGRARAGQTPETVNADLSELGTRLQSEFPNTNNQQTFSATPLRDVLVGEARAPLLMLLGAVAFVLLVACANVASLLLARASVREGELAVRAALGAGRGRLLRQLITEALVLGVLGGAVGLSIAYAGTTALVRWGVGDIPRLDEVGIDGTVMAFTLGVALVTALLFGAVPALQSTGARLGGALRAGGRGVRGGGSRVRSLLVVAEMGLAVVLLMGAGLLIRSFVERMRVDPGFEAENALTFRVSPQGTAYEQGQQIRDFVDRMFEEIRALPGVVEVAGTSTLPAQGLGAMINFAIGTEPPPPGMNAEIGITNISPTYFEALGTPMVSGRAFTTADRTDAPAVAILNESAVRRWFNGEDPVGRRATIGIEREIVGVVKDVLQHTPGTPPVPQAFTPYLQRTSRTVRVVVRTAGDPLALAGPIRQVMARLDPDLPITEMEPLHEVVTDAMTRPRFYTSVLALFAALAVALAAIGIFGVMSYGVAQRAREIGIRMALGAPANRVVAMIVTRALLLASIGLVLGLGGGYALRRVLQSQLYQVEVVDPLTVAGVVLVLAVSAAAASLLPARRAASLDPGLVLRDG